MNQEPDYSKAIVLTGWVIMFIGLLAFAGWISGYYILSSFSLNYIPMAPVTAIITMVFGFFFFSGAYKPSHGRRKWLSLSVLSFCSFFGFLVFLGFFWNTHNFLEDLLFPITDTAGKFTMNHMSPYSGLLFVIVGVAFGINILFARRKNLPNLISSLGLTVAFAGFVAMLGYLFGTPFLYGGHFIPLSIPTSIVFLLLGLGLIGIAGPKGIFLRQFVGNTASARVLRAILPVVLSAIIFEDLLDIYISDDLHINPALLLSLLTIIFSILTTLVVVRLTKNIFRSIEKAEHEIELQKTKFQQLFENSPIGIVMIDGDEKVRAINKSFETIFQFTIDEIKGKSINEFIVPAAKTEEFFALKAIASSGKIIDMETVRKRKDGSLVPVHAFIVPVSIEDRQMGLYGMFLNITERKQRELEIQIQSEIGHSVSITSNLTELMELIHNSLRKMVYAENCFFALYDDKTGLFSFPYFVDQFDTIPTPLAMSKSCTSYVFRSGESLIITPMLFQQLKDQNMIELVGSASPSWIGVILKISSKTIGVLVLQHYKEENVYNDNDLRFLDSVGSQIANVIERRRAKEAFEKSFSLVTATLESTADGILVVDKDEKVTNFNRKFVELWRIPESILSTHDDEKLISFVLDQLIDPEGFLRKVNELYLNEDEISIDLLEFKDGRIYERYSQSQQFEGTSIGRVWSFRNVTERKQAEEALHTSQRLIEGIINTISVRIFWKDKDLVYQGCNTIFALDAGFSDPKDIIGKNDFQMGWRDQAESYRKGDRQVMESGDNILLNEEPQTTPEGNTIILLTNKIPLRNSIGEIYGILGTSMNITDRIAAVEEIKLKNEELQKLNAEKDKFFSIIAHDLRSPFNSIIGFSEILVQQVMERNYEGIEEYSGIILHSSQRAMDLLMNLMEWSRSQTGKMEFSPQYFDIDVLINDATELLSDVAHQKSIVISRELPRNIRVFADKAMIDTILRNLISNAIKFTDQGGTIIVSVEQKQDELMVTVSDNGVGISADAMGKLFRIEESYSTKGTQNEQGTGLGLILCKEFIEKHGGKIWAESEVGKGSKFCFTIPNLNSDQIK